jgi:adenine-specific DNA glycosylase
MKKLEPPLVRAVAAAIRRDGKLLLVQRPPRGLLGGMWTFPGGELPNDQAAEDVLTRQALTQTGLRIHVRGALGEVRHQFTHRSLRLTVFDAALAASAPRRSRNTLKSRWIDPARRLTVALATVDRKALELALPRDGVG